MTSKIARMMSRIWSPKQYGSPRDLDDVIASSPEPASPKSGAVIVCGNRSSQLSPAVSMSAISFFAVELFILAMLSLLA
uniref:Uncharacterized protein n=1 Tax=Panagrellus redivivus TaxID=6233 RepID=A0A7E4VXQ9_PANRE